MKYITLLLATLLTACVVVPKQEPTTVTQQLDSQGNVMSETRTESAATSSDRNIELTRRECLAAQSANFANLDDDTAQVAIAAINALNPNDPCRASTNSNDVIIAANQERTKQTKVFSGGIPIIGGAYVAGEAVQNRDANVVNQPAPLIVEQPEVRVITTPAPEVVVVEPFLVNPVIVE